MHAMKKIKSLLFLGLFMMTSCLDILDKEPLDIILIMQCGVTRS